MAQDFYTMREVAAMLRVSRFTVSRLIAKGELAATRVGRQYRISVEAFGMFQDSNTSAPTSTLARTA